MTITERTLRKWRKEALVNIKNDYGYGADNPVRKILFEIRGESSD